MKHLAVLFFATCCAFAAHAKQSLIQEVKPYSKKPTKVMILASAHLRAIKEPITFADMGSVVGKLDKFSPDAIAIEALRPSDILAMQMNSQAYESVVNQFVGQEFIELSEQIQQQLSLTAIEARIELTKHLDKQLFDQVWHEQAVKLAIASYEKHTALLHYAYLQSSKAALAQPIEAYLAKLFNSNNEIKLIAINVAMKHKHVRLYPMDDHLDKDQYLALMPKLMPSMKKSEAAKKIGASEYVTKIKTLMKQGAETKDWDTLYRWLNGGEYQRQVLNDEWRLFLDKDLAVEPALARVALWEVRNLNMVSNIMRLVADNVGGEVLVIVGANHKVFFESYLRNMIGVEVVQYNELSSI